MVADDRSESQKLLRGLEMGFPVNGNRLFLIAGGNFL